MNKRTILLIVGILSLVVFVGILFFHFVIRSILHPSISNQPNHEESSSMPSPDYSNQPNSNPTTTDNPSQAQPSQQGTITIRIGGQSYSAQLETNPTAQAFLARLPIALRMSELNGNEKYHYFADSLPSNPASIGEIHAGDLMLYGDDCLVLFYESFSTTYHYTRIGHILDASHLSSAVGPGDITISFFSN